MAELTDKEKRRATNRRYAAFKVKIRIEYHIKVTGRLRPTDFVATK